MCHNEEDWAAKIDGPIMIDLRFEVSGLVSEWIRKMWCNTMPNSVARPTQRPDGPDIAPVDTSQPPMKSYPSEMRLYRHDSARLYVNEAERLRFLAAATMAAAPIRSLCLTLAYTGCRISEALEMTARSIQTDDAVISLRTLKKRNQAAIREVPVPKTFATQLKVDLNIHYNPESPETLWPIARSTAWRQVKTIMAKADITGPQATAKGLRHGFGVHALHSGVPLNLLQKWMGHADIAVTAIYGNAVGPEERAIAERMW